MKSPKVILVDLKLKHPFPAYLLSNQLEREPSETSSPKGSPKANGSALTPYVNFRNSIYKDHP